MAANDVIIMLYRVCDRLHQLVDELNLVQRKLMAASVISDQVQDELATATLTLDQMRGKLADTAIVVSGIRALVDEDERTDDTTRV